MRVFAPWWMLQHLRTFCPSRQATLLAVIVTFAVGGCGNEEQTGTIGTRQWGPYEVTVETRPWPPRVGQNEVVVMIVGERRQPIYDALVTMRAQASSPWIQAIEDGHVGVYRRAVRFGGEGQSKLQIQLQRGDEKTVLDFPVALGAQP